MIRQSSALYFHCAQRGFPSPTGSLCPDMSYGIHFALRQDFTPKKHREDSAGVASNLRGRDVRK